MVENWFDDNFKSYTTEDLLDTAMSISHNVSVWERISAKVEIHNRVAERMIQMGMPYVMSDAYKRYETTLKNLGWR
jgi:hypothetical protein